MIHLLFICGENSTRSQMAEAFARARAGAEVVVASAGIRKPAPLHPLAVQVMAEVGIDIAGQTSKRLADLPVQEIDVAVALCSQAAEECTMLLPGQPAQVNWNLPDPGCITGSEVDQLAAFRESRDTVRRLVDDLFDRGYLQALAWSKNTAFLILDSLSEGIIAHDIERRIIFFNGAAETITGYSRREVIGRDCHEVFSNRFCGSQCSFCEGEAPAFDSISYPLTITTKTGESREIDMSVRGITTEGRMLGVLASFRDRTREHDMARRLGEMQSFRGIIGRDKKMLEVFDLIRRVADASVPVLIQGDSGTGKELVAAAIHNEGPRANKLFVPVNCGALPESLLESELFGHMRGAFTGATRDKKGRFELADGGTIFLDEIGDISPAMQVKLLRVLQEGTFERVGGTQTLHVDVRVISATNKSLTAEIAAGRFREDLYYRLCVVPITLPPLRERCGDIPLLVDHILERIAKETARGPLTLAPAALDALLSYPWPGNIRELQNALQFALVKTRGTVVEPEHLPPHVLRALLEQPHIHRPAADSAEDTGRRGRRRKLDPSSVHNALAAAGGNKAKAARLLGVGRATLYRFLDDHPE